MFSSRLPKFLIIPLIAIVLSVEVLFGLGIPENVSAQGAPVIDVSSIGVNITAAAKATVAAAAAQAQRMALAAEERARQEFYNSLLAAGLGSLIHASSYFARKLAYDTANYVAHGGKGQSALVFQDGFGSYLEHEVYQSMADGLGELGKPFGLNLCAVPDAQFNIFLQIGIPQLYPGSGPQPNCQWQDLKNGGIFDPDAWTERYGTTEGLDRTFSQTISVSNSSLGVALGAIAQVDRLREEKKESAKAERLEGNGFKSLTSAIAGDVKTPAQIIKEETTALTAKHQGTLSATQVAGIYGSGASQILPMAGSVFLNTLTTQLLSRVLTEGLFPERGENKDGSGAGSDSLSDFYAGTFTSRKKVERAFNFLFTTIPKIHTQKSFNVISELSICPDNPGTNNCIIDNNLQQLLAQANVGEPLTIQEALDIGLLGDNPLIPPTHIAHSDIEACQNDYYCYSNIQKLRKLRILPLGFEVAVLNSDPDNPWTLQDVVYGFDDCIYDENDPTKVIVSANKEFCHLINPNWIIMAPDARCEMEVPGPFLENSQIATRREECVDISTCLRKDDNGNCLDFGYCTKEENVWRIDGDACPSEYNTCKTYVQSGTNKVASYLSRTVDSAECNEDSVGCRAYSAEKQGGEWVSLDTFEGDLFAYQAVGRNPVEYIKSQNDNSCTSADDGCHAFIPSTIDGNGDYTSNPSSEGYIFIKKAPEYLGCYDTNTALDSPEINWPETKTQAQQLVLSNDQCNDYAHVCVEEEVGCDSFTPVNGGLTVPAIIGSANACPSACVGYDSFKQEASAFEAAEFPVYFIPDTANTCTAEAVGCSEFTNLGSVPAGGEQLEYYTDIRHCELPTENNQKTYYTWEGSLSGGYNLQTMQLRVVSAEDRLYVGAEASAVLAAFPEGSPVYANDIAESLIENNDLCNEDSYVLKIDDPYNAEAAPTTCHLLYDDEGNTYYRLLTETVWVSEDCYAVRKTESEILAVDVPGAYCSGRRGTWDAANDQCIQCENNGEYLDGACVYQTLPGASPTCTQQENGCRAFTGNQAGNVAYLFEPEDDFEPTNDSPEALVEAMSDWSHNDNDGSLRVSGEATDLGLHSLQVESSRILRTISTSTIATFKDNNVFQLAFWAKGVDHQLTIQLQQGNNIVGEFVSEVSLSSNWNNYEFGPLEITDIDTTQPLLLVLRRQNNTDIPYFIDHVSLSRWDGLAYLIKDSWNTPLSCDATPQDGLPGAYLGCEAYTDGDNQLRYATEFEQLCRASAVGCMPMWDTYNTLNNTKAEAYMLWCEGNDEENCTITVGGNSLGDSCIVPRNGTGCYVDHVTLPEGKGLDYIQDFVVPSTVFIPADTAVDAPLYLTNNKEARCDNGVDTMGCELVGQEDQFLPGEATSTIYRYNDVMIKNDPRVYDQILCHEEVVACSAYGMSGGQAYFKDPALTGQTICYYKEPNADVDGYGWYREGVGQCSQDGTLSCREDANCGDGNTCNDIGNVPCYADYQRSGGLYDIWSSASDQYEGFVGVCPAEYNQCSEFVDRIDISEEYPNGKPYYYLYNDRLKQHIGAEKCDGAVSLIEGCVLFDQTAIPNKYFDAAQTYENSENVEPPYGKVTPASTQYNDSNIIIEVTRDRQCSEWLACSTYMPYTDDSGNKNHVCYEYKACEEVGEGFSSCGRWADDFEEVLSSDVTVRNQALRPLDYKKYVTRGISWHDEEYTGYSLFNRYPIGEFDYISFDLSEDYELDNLATSTQRNIKAIENQSFLARVLNNEIFEHVGEEDLDCYIDVLDLDQNTDWRMCGFTAGGRCYNEQCIFPMDGNFPGDLTVLDSHTEQQQVDNILSLISYLQPTSCKGYAEVDAPYSTEVLQDNNETITGHNAVKRRKSTIAIRDYEGANVCQSEGGCACDYTKVTYKDNIVDYFDNGVTVPDGVCLGGKYDGKPCVDDGGCTEYRPDIDSPGDNDIPGVCSRAQKKETFLGFSGYCLEYDDSRPIPYGEGRTCLTWLPIQMSASPIDIYNLDPRAGYYPDEDAVSLDANGGEYRDGGEVYCTQASNAGLGPYDEDMLVFKELDNTIEDVYSKFNGGRYSFTKEDIYTGLYSMLWHEFRTEEEPANNVILRFERSESVNIQNSGMGNQDFSPVSFAPNTENAEEIFGRTIMHPPIFDLDNENPVSVQAIDNNLYTRNIHLGANAPGEIYTDIFGIDESLYRSPFENIIREQDINKLYFVPLYEGIFAGNDKHSNDAYIDFAALREGAIESPILAAQVNSAIRPSGNTRWQIFTYMLKRGELLGDFSYIDYDSVGNVDVSERNNIDKRYMFILSTGRSEFTDEGRYMPNFANFWEVVNDNSGLQGSDFRALVPRKQIDSTTRLNPEMYDPFILEDCTAYPSIDDTVNLTHSPWLAIGLDFNKEGEFLGYISRWCSQGQYASGVMFSRYAVVAEVADRCTEFTQVYNNGGNQLVHSNKAWTDRVWKNAKSYSLTNYPSLSKDILNAPFGSLSLSGNAITSENKDALSSYGFGLTAGVHPGIPYSCVSDWLGSNLLGNTPIKISGTIPQKCGTLDLPGIEDELKNEISSVDNINTAYDNLHELFSKFYKLGRVTYGQGNNVDIISASGMGVPEVNVEVDTSFDNGSEEIRSKIPQIYSINPYTCNETSNCTAGELHNITVGDRNQTLTDYNGDGLPDEDFNRDGKADAIIAKTSYVATLKFFAIADHNHMPISRVTVDWADNSKKTNANRSGSYKNRKPVCEESDDAGDMTVGYCVDNVNGKNIYNDLACDLALDSEEACPTGVCTKFFGEPKHFGDLPRACTEEYFEFMHEYHCEKGKINILAAEKAENPNYVLPYYVKQVKSLPDDTSRLLAQGLSLDDYVCVYTPRVTVVDNWGWCNGECVGEYGGSSDVDPVGSLLKGCYESVETSVSNYNISQCSPANKTAEIAKDIYPWTDYAGKVIVIP
ncbi:hypothetical protein KKG22_02510 [Patescibacteria group bacterium]|nr:hypothetical protein [Patescibacteria group bacterium]MBU1722174.1 hypothetical protein [Patescibacteria group bacterium]MBU1901125.1 hypothetical protein [Patescibacteria group bacterium]